MYNRGTRGGGGVSRVRVLFYYIYIKGLLGPRDANGRVSRSGTRSQSFLSYSKQRGSSSPLSSMWVNVPTVRRPSTNPSPPPCPLILLRSLIPRSDPRVTNSILIGKRSNPRGPVSPGYLHHPRYISPRGLSSSRVKSNHSARPLDSEIYLQ